MQVLFIGADRKKPHIEAEAPDQFLYADDIREAVNFLSHIDIEVVVLDLSGNPDGEPEESIRLLRSRMTQPLVAVVPDAGTGSRALAAGAQDFLIAEMINAEMLRRVLRYLTQMHATAQSVHALTERIESLKGGENPLDTFFTHSPVGMFFMNLEGRLSRLNATVQTMLGCPAEHLKEKKLSEFVWPEDAGEYAANLEALRQGSVDFFEIENRFLRGDGKRRWWRLTLSLLRDRSGDAQNYFGLLKDISRWKRSEDDLQKAKEVAEAMARTKSEFLANMSHEIRTPIHTITGMTELLQETDLDMEQAEYAEQVRFSADVLLILVNDILDFSKIEAGKLELEQINFDLNEMFEKAVDMVVLEAHRKDLEVILFIASDVPHRLWGDPTRFRQIVINLFNNAVKFTSAGEVQISVKVAERSGRQCTLKTEVRDTGIGISEENQARLFRSFSQADTSTTRKFGGTGLGLSISKSLAEMMDGEIGVESREGEGSTFWFTVKLTEQEKADLYEDLPEDFFADTRLLIVDDNATARSCVRNYLQHWGCRVEEAGNGEQALAKMRRAATSDPFHLALIDQRMPGIDGWQLASEVTSDPLLQRLKLILLTPEGMGSGEAKMKLLSWFHGYLSKPVKRGSLLAEVFRVLTLEYEPELAELEPAEEPEPLEEAKGLGASEPADLEPVLESKSLPERAGAESGRACILVVEDHAVNQQLFKTILEKLGHRVFLAGDGLQAVEAAGKQGFDLIFMDIQMPNMNGYDAAARLREMGVEVPIIAVTASALQEEQKKAIAAGMNHCLTKPFKKKDLVPVLDRWLPGLGKRPQIPGADSVTSGEASAGMPPAGSQTSEADVFDFSKAVTAFMGREDVVRDLLSSFLNTVKTQIAAAPSLVEQGKLDAVQQEAHAMKGGAWNLTAVPLGEAARRLEEAARRGEVDASLEALEAIRREFSRFKRVAARYISNSTPTGQ